ncbi:MAG: ATP-binding cassette domain-containing protein [Azospirillum sp.]|nr:ATP-binding cassette domain-containing protein [Azospirillum sp.]
MTAAPALDVSGLSHRFGRLVALDGVSFTVNAGEFAVLLGLNGAGKTTLYAVLTRLYANQSGSIRIFGHELRREPNQALQRLGIVFQQPTLDLDLTIAQNLQYHAALRGLTPAATRNRMAEELARIGLSERRGDKVRALSGGQRRRVEIARALMHRPDLLLLDEPTVGLDIETRQALETHVRALCRERNLAVLWATHLIDEVRDCDRVIVLHRGRVPAFGGVAEVKAGLGAASMAEAFRRLTTKPGEAA